MSMWGFRNTFDLSFDGNGQLFGVENFGERDDPEEINWIREGHHYGFPWRMGGNLNPLLNSPYNAILDSLVNPLSGGFQQSFFADNPNFPGIPGGIIFSSPILNYGPDGEKFKDPNSG